MGKSHIKTETYVNGHCQRSNTLILLIISCKSNTDHLKLMLNIQQRLLLVFPIVFNEQGK